MECNICKTRSSVGYCGTCRMLLCEVCGAACQGCGKGMCPTHRAKTDSGRWLCPTCMAARNVRRIAKGQDTPAEAPSAPRTQSPAPPPAAPAVTSFADLMAGDEDLASVLRAGAAPAPPAEAPAPPAARAATAATPIPAAGARMRYTDDAPELDELERKAADLLAKSMEEEKYNERVLTGSARKGTAVWVSSLFVGGLACLLLRLVVGTPSGIQAPMRYVVIAVGLIGVIMAGQGFYRKQDPVRSRYLCLIGLLLSAMAVLVCLLGMRA